MSDDPRDLIAHALVGFGMDYVQEASDGLAPVVAAYAEDVARDRAVAELESLAVELHEDDAYCGCYKQAEERAAALARYARSAK